MKICSICQQQLALTSFDIQSTGKLGRRADCKDCRRRFIQTERGVIKSLYGNQKAKSAKRGHPTPAYTEEQLYQWAIAQPNFRALYDAWVLSGHTSDLKPSVDRLDDYQPYTLSNIQLVTWGENNQRFKEDMFAGINTKRCISVDQYTLGGAFIQRFYSYKAAGRALNKQYAYSNIRNVAEGLPIKKKEADGSIRQWIPEHAYGFVWKKP